MRRAVSGLTVRGRSFLAAGVACAASALFLGERDLLRVGVFVVALPLLALLVVGRTRYRLGCERRLDPGLVSVGRPASVVLRLENVSRLPTGVLLMEDRLPFVLGGRPRFVLDRLESRGRRDVAYQVTSDMRGRFPIGPLSVRLADPFGLVELTRSFAATQSLVVGPEVVPLDGLPAGGEWTGGGESRARSVATAGEEDVAVRSYRQGDELRRVHWRATARYGELMVRREEQPWQSRASVLLDCRRLAHRGDGPGSSFEWAVSAAASTGLQLAHGGSSIELLDDRGATLVTAGAGAAGSAEAAVLESMADVALGRNRTLVPAVSRLRRQGTGGVVVAILGACEPAEVEALARLRSGRVAAVALLLDVASWGGPQPAAAPSEAAVELASAGWHVAVADRDSDLARLWPRVARRPAGRTAGRTAAGSR